MIQNIFTPLWRRLAGTLFALPAKLPAKLKAVGGKSNRQMLEAGQRAPEVSLRQADGTSVSLADLLKQGPAVLAFFKISCPVCQMAFPYLDRLASAQTATGVNSPRVIGVSQDDAADTRAFANRFAPQTPMLLDDEDAGYHASNAYGISHVPTVFVVEQDGSISHSWTGFSKADFEKLGDRIGHSPFQPGDNVPAWRAG
ncbi:MAG: TlpA family protein disulfide reductase [Bryobacterales bacterium]|nr:TlpA family protein disulfide reductase [Bryobacterales bacterium]